MKSISVVLVLSAFVLCIHAHAVLVNPTPFNINPTTAQPCGVSAITDTMKSTPQAVWKAGKLVTVLWHLVAADGGGDVKVSFDPLGGTAFTVTASPLEGTKGSNIYYNHTFTVPLDLTCDQSPTKLCTFRMNAGSWTSCTMVKICTTTSTDCQEPPAPPKTCTAVTQQLKFCPNVTGASLPDGYTALDVDNELSATFSANLALPTVFSTPNKDDCNALYRTFLCGLNLPSCNPKTGETDPSGVACKSQCQNTMKTCGLTDLHKSLYDCNSLPDCLGASKKSGGGMSPGGAAALSIFLIALVATVAVLGFIYYKKGQLFGYTYDKDAHKIVKASSNPHNYTAYVDNEYKM